MGKIIDSLVQTEIDNKDFAGAIFARLHIDSPTGIQRYTNAPQNLYWDEDGGGDEEYIGLGNAASISVLTETQELQAQTIQLTLAGVPAENITAALGTGYMGNPIYIWYAVVSKSTYAVQGGQTGPVLIFAGRMDHANIIFGKKVDIIMNATSRLADWERVRGGRYNDSYQRRHVDPTDSGFRHVRSIQNVHISWGGETIADPGQDGGGRGDPRCFARDTKFFMQDGSLKEIQYIVPGDEMLYGGKVLQTLTGLGLDQSWYTYDGITVTGEHLVLETNSWKPVAQSNKSIPISTRNVTYNLDNENHIMVAENGTVFSDYGSAPYEIWVENCEEKSIEYLNNRVDLNKELLQLVL
jgi:hypothetical protein